MDNEVIIVFVNVSTIDGAQKNRQFPYICVEQCVFKNITEKNEFKKLESFIFQISENKIWGQGRGDSLIVKFKGSSSSVPLFGENINKNGDGDKWDVYERYGDNGCDGCEGSDNFATTFVMPLVTPLATPLRRV